MNQALGNRIKTLRTAKNFTQEQVADLIGIRRQKYVGIEGGVCNANLEVLSKIAEILGVTVGDITKLLHESSVTVHGGKGENASSKKIFDMLDLFYANKHMYEKLKWHHKKQQVLA